MRPIRLEMEGFLAYRKPTEVDFSDTELFVLTGPTGAGKSSVIDAMTFALYGTIPRLGNRSAVAPVISATSDFARVLFEFSIGGVHHVVARRVERSGSGASVTEARLESGGVVAESGSREVTKSVTELLGLGFDHFTKAVVLPQGEFASFLTDKPADRQDLLRALLDLGIYDSIKVKANERAAHARGRLETLEENLSKLERPAQDELEAAKTRLADLEKGLGALPGHLEAVAAAEERLGAAALQAAELQRRLQVLASVKPPGRLGDLAGEVTRLEEELAAKEEAVVTLTSRHEELSAAIESGPSRAGLETWITSYQLLETLRGRLGALRVEKLESDVEDSLLEASEARTAYETATGEHVALHLRSSLELGEPCPVCARDVTEIPADPSADTPDLDALSAQLDRAESRVVAARRALAGAQGQATQIEEQMASVQDDLGDAPKREEAEELLGALGTSEEHLAEVAGRLQTAREEHHVSLNRVRTLKEELAGLGERLLETISALAGESVPTPTRDPVSSWLRFEEWRAEIIDSLGSEAERARGVLTRAKTELEESTTALNSLLNELDVDRGDSPLTDLTLAVERQRNDLAAMTQTEESAREIAAQIEGEKGVARVAGALGNHLKSNNFEAWVMLEALEALVGGANEFLATLSSGGYSLRVDGSAFEVIDHFNADLRRTTRSLSGGEVFLVSLSLALAMASQLADLTGSDSRLESVFLDEGFGTLDQESLDIVASVLDELVGQGRMVGIVTHVSELAQRMPVRFEVTKGPDTARVEKVVA